MKVLYYLFILTLAQTIFAQTGTINGIVVDESNGSSLPGANIIIKELNKSVSSDSDGKFIFRNIPVGVYELKLVYIGYQSKLVSEVNVVLNETTVLNIALDPQKNVLEEVVITKTRAKAESVKSLLVQQKNSANVSDGISAETIKRTPDKNTSDVLKRISGASIQDNRFVIIRGLNDRYNAAFLNGAPLPSSESDRKAFSFDIFPSNMLDNLIITKTASPDLPGDFAGGVVQINTKSVPDKDFQTITIGSGYNTITTGKTQKTYKGSRTDFLGFDSGKRDLPASVPSTEGFSTLLLDDRVNVAKSFQSDWNISNSTFTPNYSLQYSIGRHFDIKDKTFGFMFSFSNNKSNSFNTVERNDYDNPRDAPAILIKKYNDSNYTEQVLTAALANFSLKFNDNHSLSFKNILSLNSTDLVVERSGQNDVPDPRITNSDVRWFTSSRIYSGQLNGEHYFSKPKIKLNWTGFYSNIYRDVPNLRRNMYSVADPNSTDPTQTTPIALIANNNGGPDYGGGMFWSENQEFIAGGKIDVSRKFSIGEDLSNEIKLGLFTQTRERDFFARQLQYNTLTQVGTFDSDLLKLPNSSIFNVSNMGQLASGLNGFTLFDFTKFTDAYFATSKLHAGYFMLDNRYKKFRLIWGARLESFTQTLDARKTEVEYLALNNKQNDLLPSVNLIYAITSKQNLRISYSKTLNRPEYRELAPFGFYDFTTQFFTQGNDTLKIAKVRNFDVRYEFYPGKGQLFSVSYFRKNFTNPIELQQEINNKTVTYRNAASAVNSGVELEFRTLLSTIFTNENTTVFDDLTLFANASIIKSVVDVSNFNTANTDTNVPLQGQSPFVVNVGLQYLNKDNGWVFSSNLNRVGNRIAIAGNELNPALWEKGRTIIDVQVAKNLMKNKIELKLNIQNILAQDQIFYQNDYVKAGRYGNLETLGNYLFTGDYLYEDGYNPNYDNLYWRTKFGPTFSFSMTYNF
jgi:outer membrane receptor protein involved in Fe transport